MVLKIRWVSDVLETSHYISIFSFYHNEMLYYVKSEANTVRIKLGLFEPDCILFFY